MNFKAISTISILALSIFTQNALATDTLLSCKATIASEQNPAQVIMMRVKKDGQKIILSAEAQGEDGKVTDHSATEQNYKIRSGLANYMKTIIENESKGDDLNEGEQAVGVAMTIGLVAPSNKFSVKFDLNKVDHVNVYKETVDPLFPIPNSVVSAYSADGKLLGSFLSGFVGSLIQGSADCQNGDQSL